MCVVDGELSIPCFFSMYQRQLMPCTSICRYQYLLTGGMSFLSKEGCFTVRQVFFSR